MLTTVAGTPGMNGTADGVGPAARFNGPTHIAIDDNGQKIWVVDVTNSCVRKIDVSTGAVTTFAGKCGTAGHQDSTDGTGATALFDGINAMVLGSQKDSLYVCDINNFRGIRRIDTTTGKVTSPITGLNNGCTLTADYFSKRLYYNDNNNTNDIGYFNDPVGGIPAGATRNSVCDTPAVQPVPFDDRGHGLRQRERHLHDQLPVGHLPLQPDDQHVGRDALRGRSERCSRRRRARSRTRASRARARSPPTRRSASSTPPTATRSAASGPAARSRRWRRAAVERPAHRRPPQRGAIDRTFRGRAG